MEGGSGSSGSGSGSGFDIARMSTAEKLLAGGSILFLINSFLPWQRLCIEGLVDALAGGSFDCNMWTGSGGFLGMLAGLLAIALIVLGVLSMTGAMSNVNMGTMSTDQLVGYVGLGVFGFGILKFLVVLFNEVGWAAFIGLILLVAIGWGAWEKVQEAGGFPTGGGTAGGSGGGMGGGPPPPDTPPPSAPPPSAPPPSAPPPAEPPGGAPEM
jgi:hypothetical protein